MKCVDVVCLPVGELVSMEENKTDRILNSNKILISMKKHNISISVIISLVVILNHLFQPLWAFGHQSSEELPSPSPPTTSNPEKSGFEKEEEKFQIRFDIFKQMEDKCDICFDISLEIFWRLVL